MPNGDDFKRVSQVVAQIGELIKEDIPDASPKNEAKGQEKDEILKLCLLKPDAAGLSLPTYKEIGGEETEQIHEAVPTDLNRSDLKQGWIYIREG